MNPITLYVSVAIFFSVIYGLAAFKIWGGDPHLSRWHQHWFNFVGAAVGWIAGYVVFTRWFLLDESPNFATITLLLIAFVGVTGHLPMMLMFSRWRQPNGEQRSRPIGIPDR
jgi:hypothetical protein